MSRKHWMFIFTLLFSLSTLTQVNASPGATAHHIRLIYAHGTDDISNNQQSELASLATLLQQQRQIEGAVFFIYGGSFAPSPLSSYDQGAHIVDLLNTLAPDAMVLSKRNFILSREQLAQRANQAMFPLVASNIQDSQSHQPLAGLAKSTLFRQQGTTLGLISLMDARALVQNQWQGNEIAKQSVVKSLSKTLRSQGADLVVVHYAGYSKQLEQYLKLGIIDLLIGGQHKDKKRTQRQINNIVTNKQDIAIIDLSWTEGQGKLTVNTKFDNYVNYLGAVNLNTEIAPYLDFLNHFLAQTLGKTMVPLETDFKRFRVEESAIGNFVVDTIRDYLAADIAVINSGMLQPNLHLTVNQSISRRDILRLLPYRNKTVLLEITGVKLLELLEHGVSAVDVASGRFPQVSGMKFSYDPGKVIGSRIAWVKINGQPLEFLATYSLATSMFLASGGDGYHMLKSLPVISTPATNQGLVSSLIINKIKQLKKISPSKQMRIRNNAL